MSSSKVLRLSKLSLITSLILSGMHLQKTIKQAAKLKRVLCRRSCR